MVDHGIYIVRKMGLKVFNFGDFDPVHDDVHNFLENIEYFDHSKKRVCFNLLIIYDL